MPPLVSPCCAFKEEMMDSLLVVMADGASGRSRSSDAMEIFVERDMPGPKLHQYTSLSPT